MNQALFKIMNEDIKRCVQAQSSNEGSFELYQSLVGKYNSIFDNFEEDIPKMGKVSAGGAFNYRHELNAIKEKLQMLIATSGENDPLHEFKVMLSEDLDSLKAAIADRNNNETPEVAKLDLYKEVTAKYHPYVPKLSDGLYNYVDTCAFYDEVFGDSLFHNLNQVYNKLKSFKSLGYPSVKELLPATPAQVFQINNTNENRINISFTFNDVRKKIESMSALPDKEIEEILKKIDDIEAIVKSNDRNSKKWEKAKDIIKWIADKGVDVGISLLPLLLQIG